MEKKSTKIAIIGAGVSGLIAAITLEKEGYSPTIYESTERIGGRVKTDIVDGYQLDHGFQVLLDAYPMAQKYLDYEALELQRFLPGAHVFHKGKASVIGDPLRELGLLFPTLASNVGTLGDKIKVFILNRELKTKALEELFREPETSTLQFLKAYGFSEGIITKFFKPFFSGIFLEPHLSTSSRMFQFVYKMFASGLAVLPKGGIAAIPDQLQKQLGQTKFLFNASVEKCMDDTITFSNGTSVFADYTIIATDASPLIPNLRKQQLDWHESDTLYFTSKERAIDKPLIGLIADEEALINNIFYHTSLETAQKGASELLSVTVVKNHDLSEYQLVQKVKEDLKKFCGITTDQYLKHYPIKRALPQLKDIRYTLMPSETRLTENVFLAGDYLLNGSLNAAMLSGEMAAKGVLEVLEKRN
ncbi:MULTISPECIES: protoporphyrinogen/coproporphyrinogen oxidase [Maribacter]|uniref:NAD(P)/FAD-dependent oxidoreductase n=1 Tax=Maribacter flavus TaxID=1658664 RepID=A0ABU7IHX6_9FLAO|nr:MULTISPECIES: NAD(P)/FAD-dependent oxidoreductase [Maribacter]MDC6405670.1 NAD(P)/FAD-dependent oxidoreductase [Maribacter sp. PR66]MEE1972562.1 NAD(P)/FAD-dependent oxidoreductase [Maribacter flavus]